MTRTVQAWLVALSVSCVWGRHTTWMVFRAAHHHSTSTAANNRASTTTTTTDGAMDKKNSDHDLRWREPTRGARLVACLRAGRVTLSCGHVLVLLALNVALFHQLVHRANLFGLQAELTDLRARDAGLGGAGPRGYVLHEPKSLAVKKVGKRQPQWRWVRGSGVRWGAGLKRLLELEFELDAAPRRWGGTCPGVDFGGGAAKPIEVLIAVPYRESMPDTITERLAALLEKLECGSASAGIRLTLGLTRFVLRRLQLG